MTLTKTLRTISIFAGLCAALFLVQSSRVAAHARGRPDLLDRAQPCNTLSRISDCRGGSKSGRRAALTARMISISRSARGKSTSRS